MNENLKKIKMTMVYGTAWKKERTIELVRQALSYGFRGIDTACQPKHYREDLVGQAVREFLLQSGGVVKREDLFLQTKFTPIDGQDPQQIPYDPQAKLTDQIEQSLAVSFQHFDHSYLDSLVLHSPLRTLKETVEAWKVFERYVEMGKIRQLGISNCYDPEFFSELYQQVKVKPKVLQNRFYRDTNYDSSLREFALEHGVSYQSFWTLTANPQILSHAAVKAIAQNYLKTPAQIFFRCLIQMGMMPLTGTTNEKHMQEDLATSEFFLKEEECQIIKKLLV
jgi:diketogulonate reductase-like aldo/keto reductase